MITIIQAADLTDKLKLSLAPHLNGLRDEAIQRLHQAQKSIDDALRALSDKQSPSSVSCQISNANNRLTEALAKVHEINGVERVFESNPMYKGMAAMVSEII